MKIKGYIVNLKSLMLWVNVIAIPTFIALMSDPTIIGILQHNPELYKFLMTIFALVNLGSKPPITKDKPAS